MSDIRDEQYTGETIGEFQASIQIQPESGPRGEREFRLIPAHTFRDEEAGE